MGSIWNKIFKPRVKYEPLVKVRIFRNAILHNLKEFQQAHPNLQFAPVLKSNAYGHGMALVGKILDDQNLSFFMVDSFYEALVLRQNRVKTKILILGFATPEQMLGGLKNISFGIISLHQLKQTAEKVNKKINIHLKVDTGMHRQGILPEEIDEAILIIKYNPYISLEGLCSHLADADRESEEFTKKQIQLWNEIAEKFSPSGGSPGGGKFPNLKYFHLSNTAGAFYADKIFANVSRLGLGLYGYNQSPFARLNLKPALEVSSVITSIKTIPSGEKVGYNCTYTSSGETRIATLPLGYYEGLDRRLSNKGFVKIKNCFFPIVGRISMNMCSIDITQAGGVKVGDEVNVISANPTDKNSIENMVKLSGSTEHEFRIHIPQHLRREII